MPEFVRKKVGQPSHYMIYGPGGTMKSTIASAFPKPLLVSFMDPFSKDEPYLRRGLYTEFDKTPDGILYRDVYSKKDETKKLIHLEYFHDTDPDHPIAFEQWEDAVRATDLTEYKTWVIDSYTSLESLARLAAEALPHKEEDGWFVPKVAKQMLERYMRHVFFGVDINLVLLGHVTREKLDEKIGKDSMISYVYAPAAIGAFKEDLLRIFPEIYVTKVVKKGVEHKVILQTEISSKYGACTQIPAPNGMEITQDFKYSQLWENFKE